MQNLLVVNVFGPQHANSINELVRQIADCQCNILDARSSLLGNQLCAAFMLDGSWSALAKLEHALPAVAAKLDLSVSFQRCQQRNAGESAIAYSVQIVAHDQAGLIKEITQFFVDQGVTVHEMYSNVYGSPHTGSATLLFNLTIHVPQSVSIAVLRDSFTLLCDELNLDSVMEPIKF